MSVETFGKANYFVCGSNDFGQLSALTETLDTTAASYDEFCKVGLKNVEKITFSWPQAWSQFNGGGNAVQCFGYGCEKINSIIKQQTSAPISCVRYGTHTILSNSQGTHLLLASEDGSCRQLSCEDAGVILSAATAEHVYGVNGNGHLVRGCIQHADDDRDSIPGLTLNTIPISIMVAMVACGYEHALILSQEGTVFSCGKSSRGQLGLGDIAVEVVTMPTEVTFLSEVKVKVISLAAGEWHSAAVTDTGDLYVWGWNESGQLGLPCCHDDGQYTDRFKKQATNQQSCLPSMQTCTCDSCCTSHFVRQSDNLSECSRIIITDRDITNQSANNWSDKKIVPCDNQQPKNESEKKNVCKASSELGPQVTTLKTNSLALEMDWLPLMVKQSMDPVQVMTAPYALELQEEFFVVQAACGSRHTCVVLKNGLLLTCGYNQFGQLGHGDDCNRDYLETVTSLVNQKTNVSKVFAGMWNTAVETQQPLSR